MAAAVLTAALVLPIHAHTVEQLVDWQTDWNQRAVAGELTQELMAERLDMHSRHLWHFDPQPEVRVAALVITRPPRPPSPGAEAWRWLVQQFFPADRVELALRVLECESGGDQWAFNPSGASGLFQHMARYWSARSLAAGWGGSDIFDPTANVAVAAWLSKGGTDWQDWQASRRCWG